MGTNESTKKRQVILYGISGIDKHYKVLRYFVIASEYISIFNIKRCASIMMSNNPAVEHVYAVDNRSGLRRDYIESFKKNSIESCIEFKDILEREGVKVY